MLHRNTDLDKCLAQQRVLAAGVGRGLFLVPGPFEEVRRDEQHKNLGDENHKDLRTRQTVGVRDTSTGVRTKNNVTCNFSISSFRYVLSSAPKRCSLTPVKAP